MAGNPFAQAEQSQAPTSPLANPFAAAAGSGAGSSNAELGAIRMDPDFQALVKQHELLGASMQSEFNGPTGPHLDAIFRLQDKLIAKYGDVLTPNSLSQMVDQQMPAGSPGSIAQAIQQYQSALGAGGAGSIGNPITKKYAPYMPAIHTMLGISNVLAPLQIPQQALFHSIAGVTQAVKAMKGPGTLTQKIDSGAQALGAQLATVPVKGLLEAPGAVVGIAPGVPENKHMTDFGTLLKGFGVKNETAARVGGLVGDVFVDPLLFGAWVGGIGKAARFAGLAAEGDKLVDVGKALTEATSPVGAVKLAGKIARTTPAGAQMADRVSSGMADLVGTILNHGAENTAPGAARNLTWGEMLTSESRNPLKPGLDYYEGGSGAPFAYARSLKKSRVTMDAFANNVSSALENIANTLTWPITKGWLQDVGENLSKYRQLPGRLAAFPSVVQDRIMSLASEAADNVGVLQRPGAQALLSEARTGVAAQSAASKLKTIAPTFGEEVQQVAKAGPLPAGNDIAKINESRVRALAGEKGIDPSIAAKAYNDVLDQLVQINVQDAWYKTLAPAYKESLYAAVGAAGGTAEDAGKAWQDIASASIAGEDWRNVEIPGMSVTMPDGTAKATTAGDIMPPAAGPLDLGVMFRSWNDGHLRHVYAAAMPPQQVNAYLRGLQAGNVVPNAVIDSGMYDAGLKAAVAEKGLNPKIPDLIKEYAEAVSPTIPEERGFIIPQTKLIQHMVENGVAPAEAKAGIQSLIELANPDMKEFYNSLQEVLSERKGAGGARSFGPSTGKAAVSPRTLGVSEEPPQQAADVQTMNALGRLVDGQSAVLEAAKATVTTYPTAQFLSDVWRDATDRGLLFNSLEETPTGKMNYERFVGTPYGPLNGMVGPKFMVRTVDNALKVPTANRLMAGYTKFRQGLYATWLASPSMTTANVIAHALNGMYGGFSLAFIVDAMLRGARMVHEAGSFENLPHYPDMGEHLMTGFAHNAMAREVNITKAMASGVTQDNAVTKLQALASGLGDGYKKMLLRPTSVLGPVEDKVPGLKQFGTAIGLSGFEYLENITKVGTYEKILAETGDAQKAYRAAQHVVFDYSQQPELIKFVRNTGLVPFPAFPAFVAARQVNALINRPGTLAAADRLETAIWNAESANEDQKRAIWANMNGYMRNGGYIPIRINQAAGRADMFPMKHIFPTSPYLAFQTFAQTAGEMGIYQTPFDLVYGIVNQGNAALGAKYGQHVFMQAASPIGKVRQAAQFVLNNFMPGFARRMFAFGEGGKPPTGALPALYNVIRPMPGDGLGSSMEQLRQLQTAKLQKDAFDQAVSFVLRSAQPLSFNVATSRVLRGAGGGVVGLTQQAHNIRTELQQLQKEYEAAATDPTLTAPQRQVKIKGLSEEYTKLMLEPIGRIMDAARGGAGQSP